jgi:hypothetical protein
MFNRYHNSLTLGKMGVSEQYHVPSAGGALTFPYNSVSGIMNLKSHYNLAGGRDTRINLPPQVIGSDYNYIISYYYDATDRSRWVGWPGTNYVPLYNDFSQNITTPLKRGDIVILIMNTAEGALHVPQTSTVYTKNGVGAWSSFGTFADATGPALSAFWIRIPQNATDDQLINEYPYITRNDVIANGTLGSSTTGNTNATDGRLWVLRGVPTNRNPFLNQNLTSGWVSADNNEIAQRTSLKDFGKYNTLYLNYVYTQIITTSSPPDTYPDTYGSIYSNDFTTGAYSYYGNASSDNSQYETWSVSWFNDNNPRMYSTSPIYNNKLQRHNFIIRTYPAITGFFDVTGGITIEIPY